ncbi:MAG: beta-N-acetylhexosaminidase [Sedimentisphaeraceae bacterium JB056]
MNLTKEKVQAVDIIPQPNNIVVGKGEFVYDEKVVLCCDDSGRFAAEYLAGLTESACGFKPEIVSSCQNKCISFSISDSLTELGTDGYKLEVTEEKIAIYAAGDKGLFYGVQTIRQLCDPKFFSQDKSCDKSCTIPCITIIDKPRFEWRGLHLDVARHFMPIEFVEKFIDLLAMHKMNVFHLHLTEDQGWRIEIKKYPKLTEVGAYRDGTLIGHKNDLPHEFDNVKHGGYYTQQQLRELVKYASDRGVTIVPEIELPGHAMAALAAYPEYSCTGGPHEVQKSWGIFDDIYCAGNDDTFTFLQDILDEVLDIFPSKYIHIGGDEAPKKRWEECPKCQARMKAEKLETEEELQSYFIKRIEKYLNSKGRNIIGWDEILEGGLAPNAAVMSWRGEKGGIEAANQGHKVVMTPTDYCYLDFYQSEDKEKEPLAIGGYLPLEKAYLYEPIPKAIDASKRHMIMGIQGNIWTEYMQTPEVVEYMTFPRACALAEVAWTMPENKDQENFEARLKVHEKRLDKLGVKYRK